jgi:uncharacterized membrane protein
MRRIGSFLAATLLGGIVFMFPIAIIGALLKQAFEIMYEVSNIAGRFIPEELNPGMGVINLVVFIAIVLICMFAGIVAQHRFADFVKQKIESKISLFFPRYAIFKAQLAGNIGGKLTQTDLIPVSVHFDDSVQVAFEVERPNPEMVTIYVPGSPDPWGGAVLHVRPERVMKLEADISEIVNMLEQLGRNSSNLTKNIPKPA